MNVVGEPAAAEREVQLVADERAARRSPVQFTDASVGGVTDWAWDFGDGTTSTEQNPLHTYVANGKFTVKLTVTSPTRHQHPHPHRLRDASRRCPPR